MEQRVINLFKRNRVCSQREFTWCCAGLLERIIFAQRVYSLQSKTSFKQQWHHKQHLEECIKSISEFPTLETSGPFAQSSALKWVAVLKADNNLISLHLDSFVSFPPHK